MLKFKVNTAGDIFIKSLGLSVIAILYTTVIDIPEHIFCHLHSTELNRHNQKHIYNYIFCSIQNTLSALNMCPLTLMLKGLYFFIHTFFRLLFSQVKLIHVQLRFKAKEQLFVTCRNLVGCSILQISQNIFYYIS